MGTGLGGESYAIIGQERIGQLLSSKPLDRRAIIEEAAGITRFKTKKRLAELRLEAAKQNLSRVNDIFDEVTRQMTTLKRQAAKAERYGALREELRTRLRVVLASRMSQLDAEQAATAEKIALLATQIDAQSATVDAMDAEHSEGIRTGYALDQQIREPELRPISLPSSSSASPPAQPQTPTASLNSPAVSPQEPTISPRPANNWQASPANSNSTAASSRTPPPNPTALAKPPRAIRRKPRRPFAPSPPPNNKPSKTAAPPCS